MFDINIKSNQAIIIGGGYSIKKGIKKGLFNKIKDKFTIGCNYSYKYFNSTILCYVDKPFYEKQSKINKFKKIPLVIGKYFPDININSNTIPLKVTHKYNRDLSKGVYKSSLVGYFALSLAIHLLDKGEIFLLGFDFGEIRRTDYDKLLKSKKQINELVLRDNKNRPLTHFYQNNIEHRGIGKINFYNGKDRAKKDFSVYLNEKKVKIYNVSLISKIPDNIFQKISYDKFFKKLNNKQYNQNKVRAYIKNKCLKLKKIHEINK